MKKGRLSEVEQVYITAKATTQSYDEIAKALDRTPAAVRKFVKSLPQEAVVEGEEEEEDSWETPEQKGLDSIDLMTSPDKERGKREVIMTAAASARGDESAKKAASKSTVNSRHKNDLFTTKGKKIV